MKSLCRVGAMCVTLALIGIASAPAEENKPVKGLAAYAELIENKDKVLEIRLTLKNVSDKPLAVCVWLGQRSVEIVWTGPDGKPRESNAYEWLKAVRLRNVTADDFVTLKPGEKLVIGPRGRDSTLKLEGIEPGKHQVKLTYKSTQDGKALGVVGEWTGSVTADPVKAEVK
jgi:hypothetical protein